jgi:acyl carrier protein
MTELKDWSKLTPQDTKDVLVKYLNETQCKKDGTDWTDKDVNLKTRFKEDLNLDSLDMVELLMTLEDDLLGGDFYMDEKLFKEVKTVGQASKEIKKYVTRISKEQRAEEAKKTKEAKGTKGTKGKKSAKPSKKSPKR